ncbi:MAG: NBR1-Ig-like domain-containing protein [Thermoflexales bacterium]
MVAIITPPDGARYEPGETIPLTVAAVASRNVVRVEIMLDEQIVATQPNPQPSLTFSTRIAYAPRAQGRLRLRAVAVDAAGVASEPYTLTLIVGEETPAVLPPIETTPVVGAGGCVLTAAFVTDVSIPDGASIAAGATFTKTWRMRNTSGCDWGEGYTIAFFSDTPMHPTGREPIRPTPSNGLVDISVPLTAPTQPGVYTTTWRLKDPNGRFFGNRVFAVIRVP